MRLRQIILCALLTTFTASANCQSFVFSDTSYFIQLTDLSISASDKKAGKFRITQPDGPCVSELVFNTTGQRFTVSSPVFEAQGPIEDDIMLMNKYRGEDFYNYASSVQLDILDEFPYIYGLNNDSWKPEYMSKYSMTYEKLDDELIKQYFGEDFQAIQIAGSVKVTIERKGLKSISVSRIKRDAELIDFRFSFTPNSAFVIGADSDIKYLTEEELSKWFPAKDYINWIFYDPESGQAIWKSNLENDVELKENWLFLDQPIKNKPPCGSLGESVIYLYPNPTFGDIKLQLENLENGTHTFEVYNIIGKTLFSRSFQVSKNHQMLQYRLKGLSKGTYLYSIKDSSGRRIQSKRLTIVGY